MKEASVRFDAVMSAGEGDEALAQNVPDLYLDPVTLSFVEPDYSRLDKPVRPPPPAATSPIQLNGHSGANAMSPSDGDPFSNQSASPAEALFNNDDAFSAFNNKEVFPTFSSSGFGSASSSAFPTPTAFNS